MALAYAGLAGLCALVPRAGGIGDSARARAEGRGARNSLPFAAAFSAARRRRGGDASPRRDRDLAVFEGELGFWLDDGRYAALRHRHGNEHREFDEEGYVRRRDASANDYETEEFKRKFRRER